MTMETSYSPAGSVTDGRTGLGGAQTLDPLKPLIAGARARGIADGLDLAGVPAVLIDAGGMVLHAGAAARRFFGPDLSLQFDHLVGRDGDSTVAVQKLISKGLGQGDLPDDLEISRADGGVIILRARRVPGAAVDNCQILKLLIIIEEQRR